MYHTLPSDKYAVITLSYETSAGENNCHATTYYYASYAIIGKQNILPVI